MPKGEWRDGKGKLWKIEDMPVPYLINACKFLRKRMDLLIDAIGIDTEFSEDYIECAQKLLELLNEYLRRRGKKLKSDYLDDIINRTMETSITDATDTVKLLNDGGLIPDSPALAWRKKFKKT